MALATRSVFELVKYIISHFDEFPSEYLPVCLTRAALGNYFVTVDKFAYVIVGSLPVIVYAAAYLDLYRQYKAFEAVIMNVNASLMEIKKRLKLKSGRFVQVT